MEKNHKLNYFYNKAIQEFILFFILSILLIAYALINHYDTGGAYSALSNLDWKTSPYLFPILIGIALALLSFFLLNKGIKEMRLKKDNMSKEAINQRALAVTIIASLAYYKGMAFIGFIPSTLFFLAFMFIFFGIKKAWLVALVSIAFSLGIYGIFAILLKVMLP